MLHNRLAKLREERENGEHGFTLIELLVVVVIIGILIAIAIPLYLNYKKGAADKSAQSDLRGAISTLEQCSSNNSTYPTALGTQTTGVNSYAAMTGCANQTITFSSGTTLSYYPNTGATAYMLLATNSNGNATGGSSGYYCYTSAAGGSVALKTGTQPTAYAANC